jgi:hypothetical protein
MSMCLFLGRGLSPEVKLPNMMNDVKARARLVESIDRSMVTDFNMDVMKMCECIGTHIRTIEFAATEAMPGLGALERLSVALQLWSGCLSAAKTIAYKTAAGVNTPKIRAHLFQFIDYNALACEIYKAGVEAAPLFKQRRHQKIFMDGVPNDSPVRRYLPHER